jgi:hypothetical protein
MLYRCQADLNERGEGMAESKQDQKMDKYICVLQSPVK